MVPVLVSSSARILVAGDDADARGDAAVLLAQLGFQRVSASASLDDAAADPPALIVLVGSGLEARCAEARAVHGTVPVAALVAEDEAAERLLGAGVDEILRRSTPAALARARLERLIAATHEREAGAELALIHEAMLQVHLISTMKGSSNEALREILVIAAEVMGFERAALVAHVDGSSAAYVVAATDEPSLLQFVVSVDNYPEIGVVLASKRPLLLDDVRSHPVTKPVAELLAGTDVRGVAVFPVLWKGAAVGAVQFRKSTAGVGHLGERRMVFARMFAAHAASCLQHGRVLESLREGTTHRMSRARYEAERRLRTIESLKEHFEASADGVLVLDAEGTILFVNRAAEGIIGFARVGLIGTNIAALMLGQTEAVAVKGVIEQVLGGHNLEAFDLEILTTSGEPICASITTSTVLGASGAAVLSFRDVTDQRALQAELRQTKEFLEKLVNSTVDAIVAADMRGHVIIFNQGAERLYGYSAAEVIGRIPVWELYGEGVPQQIMRMLRSTQYGGVGRLEQTRREILNKGGELVPVNMTASIIYKDGREVATVGIMSDLRERIRIEQRLLQAQEKLLLTEKQALVAELAGTAAHELNQPLTSIMGYAELIERQSRADAPHLRAVEIILREAERMAEIVKKIGRITQYETKEYVGSTRMLDLDRSARGAGAQAQVHIPTQAELDFESEVTTQITLSDVARRARERADTHDDLDPDDLDDPRVK